MFKFLIVFEKTENGYSAYSPDLDGCVATGSTKKEAEKNMYEAMGMHIRGVLEDKTSIPKSRGSSEYILFDRSALSAA
jgi:predicted RNase H-like HicB family nuclease